LLYVVYYCGSMLLSLVIPIIPNLIISIIFSNDINNIRTLTGYVLLITVYLISIFILFYRDGYKKNVSYDNNKIFNRFILSAVISYIIYYLIGIIIYIFSWTTFMVIHSPTYICLVLGALEEPEDITFKLISISSLITIIPIFIFSLSGFKTGINKRKKDRSKIIKNN